jgi:hypothetical protein
MVLQDNTMQCNMNEYMTMLIVMILLSDAENKTSCSFQDLHTVRHETSRKLDHFNVRNDYLL